MRAKGFGKLARKGHLLAGNEVGSGGSGGRSWRKEEICGDFVGLQKVDFVIDGFME